MSEWMHDLTHKLLSINYYNNIMIKWSTDHIKQCESKMDKNDADIWCGFFIE
jgi:hypothetical protein